MAEALYTSRRRYSNAACDPANTIGAHRSNREASGAPFKCVRNPGWLILLNGGRRNPLGVTFDPGGGHEGDDERKLVGECDVMEWLGAWVRRLRRQPWVLAVVGFIVVPLLVGEGLARRQRATMYEGGRRFATSFVRHRGHLMQSWLAEREGD